MKSPKYLDYDEAEAFKKALSSALNGERRPTPAAISKFLTAVYNAAAEEESWATKYLAEAARRCGQMDLKALAKSESLVAVAYNNSIIYKPSLVGVRTPEGQQQVLFETMTWDQLRDNAQYEEVNADARKANAARYRKLLTLEKRVPGAATVGEACKKLGITVEEFLSAESA